jgi:hypothetical protein
MTLPGRISRTCPLFCVLLSTLFLATDAFAQNKSDGPAGTFQFLINEVDADQTGTDGAEFVEIFDGGLGNNSLDGLVLVFYNGSNDLSYLAFDLDGQSTDADGYFVLCGDAANVPDCDWDVTPDTNLIQNGQDAVALYSGDATSFPNNTAVTTTNLLDALVYDTSDADDAGLLVLLNASQPQVDENANALGTTESNQRCPNGTGGARNTSSYDQFPPTPGAENTCGVVPPAPFVCGDDATLISAIQGSGATTPLAAQVVDVEAIVTAVFQGVGTLRGLFVQEEADDVDADELTSEGLFVFTDLVAAVGDHVRIRGTAGDFSGATQLSPVTNLAVCSTGNPLPPSVAVTLPKAAADSFERYENMRVTVSDGLVVNDLFTFWRFGEYTVSSIRRFQPTQMVAPGVPAIAQAATNALDALVVDDGRSSQNLVVSHRGQDDTNPFTATNPIRIGMTVSSLTGIMHEGFGAYRLQPTQAHVVNENPNPRTAAPAAVGGTLRIGSMNVLNYFSTLDNAGPICGPLANQECRGADSVSEFNRQTAKLVAALTALNADVVGLIEIENNASASLVALVNALNAATTPGTYAYIDTGTIGADAIKQAVIFKPATVTPEGDFAVLTSAVDARFNDEYNRPSLAQSFRANDNLALFTVVVNHLKSKGSDCDALADPDTGDGQGECNITRTNAAAALADWADADPTGTGSDQVLLLGDMNAYTKEDPIAELTKKGFTDLAALFSGGANTSSYSFAGQSGTLDYILGNAAITAQIAGATIWHVNSDEAVALDYNEEFGKPAQYLFNSAPQSSDHDPLLVGLDLDPPNCDDGCTIFVDGFESSDT